jgi:alkylation response protein AidB-like acyl-CoA dehydrogenase
MTPEQMLKILTATPGWAEQAAAVDLDETATLQVLDEAAKFAETRLAPVAAVADEEGCRMENGRVKTPKGYAEVFRALGENGWITADLSPELGGMGLPIALHVAASIPMEGAALPFMMALGSTRAAAHCLAATAPELAAEWCPKLAEGEWAATICISEPDAGSDVGRIRTKAVQDGDTWRLSGTKCWISFGDHDMAERIGHLALARTGAPEDGTRGLSLFLVPNQTDGVANGIHIERIEEKLGLHGSPTCVLRFENSEGTLIGQPGRGLPALFNMIELMRLQVGTQGAGIAATCATLARHYAEDRKQGGHPAKAPVAIATHPDIQRMLLTMEARATLLAGLLTETAVTLDKAHAGDAEAAAYAPFLLPLAKTFGGEQGQASASDAIQILGGAGYTREWPAERHFRDARIITIYEGTTGMQAQDFLMRRIAKDDGASLRALRARFEDVLEGAPEAAEALTRFEAMAETMRTAPVPVQLHAADAVMRAGWVAVSGLLAARHLDGAHRRLWLSQLSAQMAQSEAGVDWAFTEAA